tara:strand:- start:2995 stop:4224 length:1230 start_codon:yes stop_codon:yes gene_type:complete
MKEAETKSNCLKKTKLGRIPMDWETQKLVELCNSKGSYGINASAVSYREDLPAYLRITDIDDEGNFSRKKKMSVDDPNYESFILQKGDVVFVRTGATVGKTYLYDLKDGELVYAGFLIKFSIKESILNSSYLKYFTQSENYWKWVNVMSVRSGQPGINGEEYGGLNVPLPPLPEQETIANCLSVWDAAITKQTKLIATKKQLKKALMQQLLSGKKRLPGFDGDWNKVSAGNIFKSVSKKNNDKEELLSVTQNKGVIPRSLLGGRVTMPSGKRDGFKLVEKGNFVISLRSFQGGLEFSEYKGLVSPAYTVLEEKQRINKSFYKHYFKSYEFIERLSIAVIGIRDGKQISYNDFCTVKIPNPEIDEQTAIALILDTVDQEIKLLKKQLKQYKQQKRGLIQQLLTGKIRLEF